MHGQLTHGPGQYRSGAAKLTWSFQSSVVKSKQSQGVGQALAHLRVPLIHMFGQGGGVQVDLATGTAVSSKVPHQIFSCLKILPSPWIKQFHKLMHLSSMVMDVVGRLRIPASGCSKQPNTNPIRWSRWTGAWV